MPREPRKIFEGAIYHVIQRGNNQEYILENANIKSFFVKQLKEYNKKFDCEILAFVIMNNHYHILVRTNKDSISRIMFFINNLMGKFLNDKLKRTGHAFEGRYYCKLVETDGYLIWLLRYIHRNPVRAHICSDVNNYSWSSHYFYKNGVNSFINTDFILKILANDKKAAIKIYMKLVESTGDDDPNKDFESIKNIFNLGENLLVNPEGEQFEKPSQKSMDEMLLELKISETTLNEIKSGSKKQNLTDIKLKIIKALIIEKYTLKEIASYLNAAPSTISKLISRNL